MRAFARLLFALLPQRLALAVRRVLLNRDGRGRDRASVFSAIYAGNRWGGSAGEFCSGSGSLEKYVPAYAAVLAPFVAGPGPTRVVDLGCGDFRIGSQLAGPAIDYLGIDIVPALIARNQQAFGTDRVRFACLDIVADPLPDGDVCLVRQVLQHLSNAEIIAVLAKLARYPVIIVTEHFPAPGPDCIPNRDIVHGASTRATLRSAVDLREPPFSVAHASVAAEVPLERDWDAVRPGERLVIMVIRPPTG